MKVTVFGTGYVGLVQGTILADVGHHVVCVDIDEAKIGGLNSGVVPFFEPGLEALVKKNVEQKHLEFTTDARRGVDHGEVVFVAVGTPPDEDGSADLKYVTRVAEQIAEHATSRKTVINKSTVPVGTADKVREVIAAKLAELGKTDIEFDVVSNPEFLKEGAAVADCMSPDRIVIGSENDETVQLMRSLYAPFNRNHDKIIVMDIRSAELTKYAANCMLATKISFMNEMANLSEKLGADIELVRKGIGSDPRIGYHFIYPGLGYGGSCFPKDVQALIRTADAIDFDATLLKAVETRNNRQKSVLLDKIMAYFDNDLSGLTFAVWGLSFKPKTDDMREAASRVIIDALLKAGARMRVFDPEAMAECRRIYGDSAELFYAGSREDAVEGSDALIVVTEWQEFKAPDLAFLRKTLRRPVIFDGRNMYEPVEVEKAGLTYYSIGR